MAYKKVYSVFRQGELGLIKSILKQSNIKFYVANEQAGGLWPLGIAMNIMVEERRIDEAKEILKDFVDKTKSPKDISGLPTNKKKLFIGVKIFGWLIIIFESLIISGALFGLFVSVDSPEAAMDILQKRGFETMREFHLYILQSLLLSIPVFIAAIAVLRRKELGRKILIIMNSGLLLYISYRIVYELFTSGYNEGIMTKILSFIIYAAIIFFFTRPKVKEQFR